MGCGRYRRDEEEEQKAAEYESKRRDTFIEVVAKWYDGAMRGKATILHMERINGRVIVVEESRREVFGGHSGA